LLQNHCKGKLVGSFRYFIVQWPSCFEYFFTCLPLP